MFWNGFPFCIFGYGFCEPEPPPPELEDETWPLWPIRFSVKLGSWQSSLNLDLLLLICTSSAVGAATACLVLYLAWRRHFSPKRRSNIRIPSQASDSFSDRPGGPLGDHDIQESTTNSSLDHQNMSIMEIALFGWKKLNELRNPEPTLRTRSRSSENRILPLIPSNTHPPQPSAKNSDNQLEIEKFNGLDHNLNPWNPFDPASVHWNAAERTTLISTDEGQKVVLHQFARGKRNPCLVPHSMKLESILRMCAIPHEIAFDCDNTGPWITFNGEKIFGAQNCIKFLQRDFASNIYNHMVPVEKKVPARYISVLLDFHLYWGVTIWRWLIDEGKEVLSNQSNFKNVFGEVKHVIQSVKSASRYLTIGKTDHELINTIQDDLILLSASLGNKTHFIGDSLTDLDCSAFAILSQMLWSTPGCQLEKLIKGYPTLVNFCLLMRQRLWSDWDELVELKAEDATSPINTKFDTDLPDEIGKSLSQCSLPPTVKSVTSLDGRDSKSSTRSQLSRRTLAHNSNTNMTLRPSRIRTKILSAAHSQPVCV